MKQPQHLTNLSGVQTDITERQQVQDQLENFFALSVDMLCITDFDGYLQQLNPAWEKTLGFTQEELFAQPFIEFVHPDDREATLAELQKLSTGISTIGFENRYRCKDGSYKWFLWNSTPILKQRLCYATGRDITERKQLEEARAKAEAALRESEAKYRALVETSQDMIWSLDTQGQFTFVNQAVRYIYGYEPEEMIGRRFTDFEPPEQHEQDWQIYQRILAGESYFQYETVQLCKNGTPIDLSVNAIVLRDEIGNLLGVTGTARDITGRKRTEAVMHSTQKFLNSVLDNLPIVVCTKDAKDLRFVYWNKASEELFGYAKEEMLGKNDYDFFTKEQADFFTAKDREVLASGKLLDIPEEPITTRNQGLRTLHTRKIPICDEQGNPQYLLAITEDITERKRIETALRESEVRFQKLVANVPGVIYQFVVRQDGSMAFPYISSGCRELYELEPEAVQQNAGLIFDRTHPHDLQGFFDSVAVSGQMLQPWRWEGRLIMPSGKIKWIQCASRPEKQANGDIVWDGLIMDISDRKQAEAALRHSEEQLRQKAAELEDTLRELQQTQSQLIQTEKLSSLGQLVAGVAHEINNPIGFIYGNLIHASEYFQDLLHLIQLYEKHYPHPKPEIQTQAEAIDLDFLVEDLPKILASMKMGADRIRQIVLSLRNFSRLDEAEMKPVDIHEGLDNTLLILQHRLRSQTPTQKQESGRPAIEVIKEYGNLPLVECYAGQLNQVFMNLLSNAIDALEQGDWSSVIGHRKEIGENSHPSPSASPSPITHHPPTIWIQTEVLQGNRVAIRITDNGSGMTEEVRQKLFDPFFTTKPVGKGTGLGLAISYQIVVEKHRGVLKCVSQPGQGAEFSIEIPTSQGLEVKQPAWGVS